MRMKGRKAIRSFLAAGAAFLSAQASADATLRSPLIPGQSCLDPTDPGGGAAATQQPPPVLVEGLGYAGLEADSTNPEARAWFTQGVRLIWAFDETEAVRAFEEAQRLDPACAMCFLGEAWARGPTINLRPRTEELEASRTAARRALALSGRLSPRDRLLVDGMMLRTRDGAEFSSEAYARFMERAAQRMPEDDTLAILAADARMQISRSMRPGSLSQRLLERVLTRNPDHGGAIHFYIHLTDWTDEQHLAEPYADRLARIAPAASHLVHMPSHTFYGVGRYQDAAATNVAAVAADSAYTARVRPPRSDYRFYLNRHNMHFAIESALARGDAATATEMSRQYREVYLGENPEQASRILGSAAWYTQGLHDDVESVLAIPEPTAAIDRALRHYARGEALARRGDGPAVAAEAAGIAALREGTAAPELGESGAKLAEIFQHILEGRAAMLGNRPAAAETAYRRAMQAQLRADFGFDPPLFWYSARRSLAAALLARGDARGARRQLEASLRHWPNDPVALYALSQAERALGNAEAAEASLARARTIWAGDLSSLPLARI